MGIYNLLHKNPRHVISDSVVKALYGTRICCFRWPSQTSGTAQNAADRAAAARRRKRREDEDLVSFIKNHGAGRRFGDYAV